MPFDNNRDIGYFCRQRVALLAKPSMHWKRVVVKMRLLLDFLYGSVPADFESDFDLEESVQRLHSATARLYEVHTILTKQAVVGRVSTRRVYLQRSIPWFANAFKPFFFGPFKEIGGRLRLTGRFTLHPIAKAFMTLWFGLVILATLAMALGVQRSTKSWAEVGYGVGMFLSGLGLVTAGKWLSRNDARWLSEAIHTALSSRKPASEA